MGFHADSAGVSAVFQAGGLVVVLVEVIRKNFLASIVPVVVSAVLNAHQLVVDIVAFVSRGDFPRSRLGEKQRGRILAGWVTRKMRTIAQFGIKDPEGPEMPGAEASSRHGSAGYQGNGSVRGRGSSLKHIESSSALGDLQEHDYARLPVGIMELPAGDDSSIMESPPADRFGGDRGGEAEAAWPLPPPLSAPQDEELRGNTMGYSPVEMPSGMWKDEEYGATRQVHTMMDDEDSDEDEAQAMAAVQRDSVHQGGAGGPAAGRAARKMYESDESEEYEAQAKPRGLRIANRTSDDESD